MKSKMKIKKTVVGSFVCLSMIFSVGSCAGDGFDEETFSSGVTNTQLESPESISFSTLSNSDGSESLKLTWPVVLGAGGYNVNVYNVNDPGNPASVVKDSIVDGCTMAFVKQEDTNYLISVQTVGNEILNNTGSQTTTEKDYKAFVETITLHEGDDIAEYVNNTMQDFSQDQEQCVNLEAGKTYHLNSIADFGLNTVTFRGNQENPPTIIIGADGGLVTEGGLKIKYINFDCSAMKTQTGVLTLGNATTSGAPATEKGSAYLIDHSIVFQGCSFKEINNSLIYAGKDNGPWAVKDFRVMDCIVEVNNGTTSKPIINFEDNGGRAIKDLSIQNSTFYNLQTNSKAYFIRMNNASNARPDKTWNDTSGSVTMTNNTFYQTMSKKDFANNMASVDKVITTIKYNIFYNTYRVQKIAGNTTKAISDNYLYAVESDNVGSLDNTDQTYGTVENPQFVGPVDKDPSEVNFVPANTTKAYSSKAGDPRWFK
jgi:hypothetical protein